MRAEIQAEKREARRLREVDLYRLNLCVGGGLELGVYLFKSKTSTLDAEAIVESPVGMTLGLRKHFARLMGWQGNMQYLYGTDKSMSLLNAEARLIFGPFGRIAFEPGVGYSYGWCPGRYLSASGYDESTWHLRAFVFCPGATLFLGARDALTLSAGPKVGWGDNSGEFGAFVRISYAIPLDAPRMPGIDLTPE